MYTCERKRSSEIRNSMQLRASTLVILPIVLLLLSGCGGGGTDGDGVLD